MVKLKNWFDWWCLMILVTLVFIFALLCLLALDEGRRKDTATEWATAALAVSLVAATRGALVLVHRLTPENV